MKTQGYQDFSNHPKNMQYIIIPPKGEEIAVEKADAILMSRGCDLLMYIYELLDITEYKQYFGLMYCDKIDGKMNWLEEDDSLKKLQLMLGKTATFQLNVSFFPEDPETIFEDTTARKIFRDIIKENLMKGELGCDAETHAYLDALLLQAEIGDFLKNNNPSMVLPSYEDAIHCLDIYNPTPMNCSSSPGEAHYRKRVRHYHKRHAGITSTNADVMYLTKAKTLPYYGFITHHMIEKDGRQVCVAMRQASLCVIDNEALGRFISPSITCEYKWSDLRYCTLTKRRVLIGVSSEGRVNELAYNVIRPNSSRDAERLFKDIVKLRDRFLGRKSESFRTAYKTASCDLERQPTAKMRVARKFSAFTDSIENSFRMLRQWSRNDHQD